MRIFTSLLKASLVAAAVFALAWIRMPGLASSLKTAIRIYIGYGVMIAIVSLLIGSPLALIADKYRLIRWWLSIAVGAATGALIGAMFIPRHSDDPVKVDNPFALSFSPWNRDAPGFINNTPLSQGDIVGTVVFGAIVGGTLGIAFWYFYSRGTRPNKRFERSRG
jgi:hypothetical protein